VPSVEGPPKFRLSSADGPQWIGPRQAPKSISTGVLRADLGARHGRFSAKSRLRLGV